MSATTGSLRTVRNVWLAIGGVGAFAYFNNWANLSSRHPYLKDTIFILQQDPSLKDRLGRRWEVTPKSFSMDNHTRRARTRVTIKGERGTVNLFVSARLETLRLEDPAEDGGVKKDFWYYLEQPWKLKKKIGMVLGFAPEKRDRYRLTRDATEEEEEEEDVGKVKARRRWIPQLKIPRLDLSGLYSRVKERLGWGFVILSQTGEEEETEGDKEGSLERLEDKLRGAWRRVGGEEESRPFLPDGSRVQNKEKDAATAEASTPPGQKKQADAADEDEEGESEEEEEEQENLFDDDEDAEERWTVESVFATLPEERERRETPLALWGDPKSHPDYQVLFSKRAGQMTAEPQKVRKYGLATAAVLALFAAPSTLRMLKQIQQGGHSKTLARQFALRSPAVRERLGGGRVSVVESKGDETPTYINATLRLQSDFGGTGRLDFGAQRVSTQANFNVFKASLTVNRQTFDMQKKAQTELAQPSGFIRRLQTIRGFNHASTERT
uniref:Uncharacterized protein n=1 Tax=Chromera velia CCMP2878 TaxID=1169474 RepID=A0A0G4G5C5_9ALVE|mmetsp:Transcript_2100/g.4423  ORF Transcript_2100/g.4423 Transcript_2100/m.4423 type:complete len:496 (+) Transcript_2100:221-1708(+)|eukprot:Cvel_20357.t1-p1 / transcript=Cvel_20357.t1 / gene=Cvel_20357 / organism=Chromera_velia_CCMP2878 / gene_product=hypothetical protein / transcript_product=hypothetical protein / location=Cvel_scaffold1820:27332-33952(-) / protein_length=495 / sequence_SO=supercontig / SO=protein_coding / is_pseudo=false